MTGIQPTIFKILGTEETYDGGRRPGAPSWLGREPGAAWESQVDVRGKLRWAPRPGGYFPGFLSSLDGARLSHKEILPGRQFPGSSPQ